MPLITFRHSVPVGHSSLFLTEGSQGSVSVRERAMSFAPAHTTLPRFADPNPGSAPQQASQVDAHLSSVADAASAESVHQAQSAPNIDAFPGVMITLASVGQQFKGLKQDVTACKERMATSLAQAEKANVYPAQRAYMQKAAGLLAGVGTMILFAALTVATGGVGPAVALGATSLMAVKSAADMRCAYKDLKNKQARAENPDAPLPYAEQMLGADAIGNWVCNRMLSAAKSRNEAVNTDAIKAKARKWSLVLNSALKVITFSAVGVTGMAMGKAVAVPMACIGMSLGAMVFAIKLDQDKKAMEARYKSYDLAKMPAHFEKLCDLYADLAEKAQANPDDVQTQQALVTSLSQAYLDLHKDLMHLNESLQEKASARSDTQAESARAKLHGAADGSFDVGVAVVRRGIENTVGKGLLALGGNAEAAASMVSATKSLYMSYRLLDRVEQRTEALVRHADQILSLRQRMQWMAV